MTVYGAVFARGGSKGVPGKSLRKIAGRSLLDISITFGSAFSGIDRMFCSTDSSEIAAEAARLGAEVPFLRPAELADDDSPEWLAWQHLVRNLLEAGAAPSDVLVSLPLTSPLRADEDIAGALSVLTSGHFDIVLGVTESKKSPWFNMVSRNPSSEIALAFESQGDSVTRRQDAPLMFDITTVVYATTLGFVSTSSNIFAGRVGSVVVPAERAVDIDTELDLRIADYLFQQKLR